MYQQIAPPRTYILGTYALQGPLYLFLLPHTHFRVSVKVAGNYRFLEMILKMEPSYPLLYHVGNLRILHLSAERWLN